ncbi:MAG: PEGA domain-containing protein [Pseudomonadota bacterium]
MNGKHVMTVALVLVTAGRVVAADAEALIAQGIDLRKDNRDQEALPLFRRAFEQQPSPRAAGQLGTCEQALGLWVGAETHIQEALKSRDDVWVQRNEARLRSALAYVQQRLGSIEVWGSPAGARVSVDGDAVGTLPLTARARAAVGQRSIAVEAEGFLPENRRVEVLPEGLAREHVVLRSLGTTTAFPQQRQSTNFDSVPAGEGAKPAGPPSDASTSPVYKEWWFWAIVGAVAVGAGGTIYFLSTRNDSCQPAMGGTCTTF